MTTEAQQLLAAYDAELRGEQEAIGSPRRRRVGPLHVADFEGGRSFISYRSLGTTDSAAIRDLVARGLAEATTDPAVREVEWKTRGHDVAPGLHEALLEAGFVPEPTESIMIGEAARLAVDVPLPAGVVVRRVHEEGEVRAASAVAGAVFGDPPSDARADDLLGRIARGAELWIAELGGTIISTGRLEPVPGTDFAGLWGGATVAAHRGRGVYRAVTAARARSALDRGVRYLQSDSTEYSRPILERSGLVKVSTTTPYAWHRGA